MILLAFCENCTWEILPMLLGAWMLGLFFWYLFFKPRYQNKIKDLNANIGALQTAVRTASIAENAPNEDFIQLSNELKSAQNLNQDFNTQLTNLRSELENRQNISAEFQAKLDGLNEQLHISRQHNSKLKADLDQLNTEVSLAKNRIADFELLLRDCKSEKEALKKSSSTIIPVAPPNNLYENAVSNQFVDFVDVETDDQIEEILETDNNEVIEVYEEIKEKNNQVGHPFSASYADFLDPTNLKIVEGVGPKIESLMKGAGIKNWEDLSNTEPSTIQNILNAAGPRYRVHDPKSWPLQARLAFKNDWEVLINLQKKMGGGKVGTKDKSSRSKVEKLVMKAKGIKAYAPDDLKIVEGIGPKIEGLLKADGISNWNDLATAEPPKIKAILTAAGDRYRLADPTTWPKQAALAAKGSWEELKAYQDILKGGIE